MDRKEKTNVFSIILNAEGIIETLENNLPHKSLNYIQEDNI